MNKVNDENFFNLLTQSISEVPTLRSKGAVYQLDIPEIKYTEERAKFLYRLIHDVKPDKEECSCHSGTDKHRSYCKIWVEFISSL